ncbi:septum formation inhibitor Maf [Shewanella algae]|uniref:Maf family protein n=1 Tax=Shewanella algae TaxID=38313 RepID=UPI001AAF0B6B|nr:Maf family protein [Shewanella algae]MBO2634496.1 septum formation inhibitor Maf [Shewanella algae]
MPLILASASPRRRELLAQLALGNPNFGFEILPADIDESHQAGETPQQFVSRLAEEKAAAGLALWRGNPEHQEGSDTLVLGSDTIVVLGDRILGKPVDKADACAMLKSLSGRSHQVMTAVALTDGKRTEAALVVTQVYFCDLSDADIQAYVASGEPMDKAGAYGIQGLGGSFVAKIEGSYSAVVGLPMAETRSLLHKAGCL